MKHEVVEDIDYVEANDLKIDHVFQIRTDKTTHRARTIVLAVGPGNPPQVPGRLSNTRIDGACHAMEIQDFPDAAVKAKIDRRQETNVMIVGGGLTSAQLTDLAIRCGVTKVWHVMRSHLKVKPFDLNLEWLGKFRNVEQAAFWSADDDGDRLLQIQTARNGGSITTKYHKILKSHVARGNLNLLTRTIVKSRVWDSAARTWTVEVEPSAVLPPIDYIYYATGIQTNFQTLPFLQTMQRKHPIHSCGGLPCITDDLMWNSEVPLFITGRLGALKIGPGAANLAGARSGAERIAWSIAERLDNCEDRFDDTDLYRLGIGNRYTALDSSSGTEVASDSDC